MKNKVVKKFIKSLSKLIVCPGRKKKEYLSEIKMELLNFTESNLDADYELLCDTFGIPADLAKEFMDNIDPAEYRKAVSKKRAIIIALSIIVAAWLITVATLWIDGHTSNHGRGVESIGDDVTGYEIIKEEYY